LREADVCTRKIGVSLPIAVTKSAAQTIAADVQYVYGRIAIALHWIAICIQKDIKTSKRIRVGCFWTALDHFGVPRSWPASNSSTRTAAAPVCDYASVSG
jgi:hypothetical protein